MSVRLRACTDYLLIRLRYQKSVILSLYIACHNDLKISNLLECIKMLIVSDVRTCVC